MVIRNNLLFPHQKETCVQHTACTTLPSGNQTWPGKIPIDRWFSLDSNHHLYSSGISQLAIFEYQRDPKGNGNDWKSTIEYPCFKPSDVLALCVFMGLPSSLAIILPDKPGSIIWYAIIDAYYVHKHNASYTLTRSKRNICVKQCHKPATWEWFIIPSTKMVMTVGWLMALFYQH